jgi:hypothetical protein
MRKGTKRLLGAGIVAGIAYAGWRAWKARVPESDVHWDNAPFPFPPVPRPTPSTPDAAPSTPATSADVPPPDPAAVEAAAFVEPGADGACPLTHPVKAKLTSGIYHLPGGGNYERTKPDRCYATAEAAEADGLRPAKR